MTVLSIDLAARRYQDCGIAVLRGSSRCAQVEFVLPGAIGLTGPPDSEVLARALSDLAANVGARLILIDGPQGWRADDSDVAHMRLCELLTRTPGKTGVPRVVKPASWTRMAVFSVAVFDDLHALGCPSRIPTRSRTFETARKYRPLRASPWCFGIETESG